MILEGYSLDLYCDGNMSPLGVTYGDDFHRSNGQLTFPEQFFGESRSDCRTQARRRGWVFHRNGLVSCPACRQAGRKPQQEEE